MTHHNRSEQLIGKRFSSQASNHLMDALKRGTLRCMRESRKIPIERKRVPASFWEGLEIDASPELGIIQIRPVWGARRDLGDLYDWAYYVWEPDIDIIWGTGATAATRAAGTAQPRQPEQPEPEQLPQPIIRRRQGGARQLLSPEEIGAGKEYCKQKLGTDPAWIGTMGGKQNACQDIILNKIPRLRDRSDKCGRTIMRKILQPVLKERGQMDR
jgi:hypothetical protein